MGVATSSLAYHVVVHEHAQLSRGCVRAQLKDFGKNLLMGNLNLINVSLPVKMFEPRSYLQKLADAWLYTNHLQALCTPSLHAPKLAPLSAVASLLEGEARGGSVCFCN